MKNLIYLFLLLWLLPSCKEDFPVPDTPPLFTFGLVTDVQYANIENAGTRYYRLSPAKLAKAVEDFNREEVDFVINLGDFIDQNVENFDTLSKISGRLKMPLYHITGNHDWDGNTDNHSRLLATLHMPSFYYAIARDGWRILCLNGNEVGVNMWKPGSAEYVASQAYLDSITLAGNANAYYWNGAMGKGQVAWLQHQLDTARLNHERVLITCHFPLYSNNPTETLWNRVDVLRLIERYPEVFGWFCGHGHTSQFYLRNGVNHVMFRGMVEEDENGWAVVTVYDKYIHIQGKGREKSRWLED